MDKAALIESCKNCLCDDFDDGEAVESFKAPLPDLSVIKYRGENDKLTKDEKKLLLHLQDLNKLRKMKKEIQAQVLKLQEEKKRKVEQEKTKKAASSNTNKLASAVQAKERAKLLLQSGAIKLPTARSTNFIQHKRSMAQRNAGRRAGQGSQDLTPPSSPGAAKASPEADDSPGRAGERKASDASDGVSPKRPRVGAGPGGRPSLYENFVPGGRTDAHPESPSHDAPRFRGGERGGNTLFVRGYSLSTELLTSAFEAYGPIMAINIEDDGLRAFVTLDNPEIAAKAMEEVHYVDGTCLQVSYARRQIPRTSGHQNSHTGRDRSTWSSLATRNSNQDNNRRNAEKVFDREMVTYD